MVSPILPTCFVLLCVCVRLSTCLCVVGMGLSYRWRGGQQRSGTHTTEAGGEAVWRTKDFEDTEVYGGN